MYDSPTKSSIQPLSRVASLLVSIVLVTGLNACGGGGGGDDDERFVPTLPANATKITDANWSDTANGVLGLFDSLSAVTALKEPESNPSMQDLLKLAADSVKREVGNSAGIANRQETENCDPSSPQGTISLDFDETANSASGVANFNNCVLGGVTVDGKMFFDLTFDSVSGNYSDDFNGSITFDFGSEVATVVFDLQESGNDISGDYSGTTTFSVAGSFGGFLVTTTEPISGNFISGDVFDGTLIVQGGENSRLRINITAVNEADIDLDDGSGGGFVNKDHIFL